MFKVLWDHFIPEFFLLSVPVKESRSSPIFLFSCIWRSSFAHFCRSTMDIGQSYYVSSTLASRSTKSRRRHFVDLDASVTFCRRLCDWRRLTHFAAAAAASAASGAMQYQLHW